MQTQIQKAQWLMRCLAERKKTIQHVIEAILTEQHAFFRHGQSHLKPMTLKHIADRLGLAESTVSRAIQNKWLQTSHGVYEMRSFFSSGLATDSGAMVSSIQVKAKIKRYIDNEDKSSPLSDQKITDLLQAEGIQISRRTVMKYREEMQLPSSKDRRASCY